MSDKYRDIASYLDNLTSYSKVKEFMKNESGLERIGSGSGREAFILDDRHVIKVAKNVKGIAQNVIESDLGIRDWYGDIVAKTIDFDEEKNRYLMAERACNTIKSQKGLLKAIENNYGVSGDDFSTFMKEKDKEILMIAKPNYNALSEVMERNSDNTFLMEMEDMVNNYSMSTGDMLRHSTWGMVDDKLCLKDYGLTKEVYEEFYDQRRMKKSHDFRM